jgi:hypothetical protein
MIHSATAVRTRDAPMSSTRAIRDRGLDRATRTTIHRISIARTAMTASASMLRSGSDEAGQTVVPTTLVTLQRTPWERPIHEQELVQDVAPMT